MADAKGNTKPGLDDINDPDIDFNFLSRVAMTYTGLKERSSIVLHCLQNRRSDLYRSSSLASLLVPVSAR